MAATTPNKVTMTTDELFATLSRSSLPTVVLEGKDDLIVFRDLESKFADIQLSVLPVGGRKAVLDLFERYPELAPKKAVAFIADQDFWVVTGVPAGYQSERLLLTTGYSIENDVFVDGDLKRFLSKEEAEKFTKELVVFVRWYALAFSRFLKDPGKRFDFHPNHILDNEAEREKLLALDAGEIYPADLQKQILEDYGRLLRGKSLMALLMRQLAHQKRTVRHHSKALTEVVALSPGALLIRFFTELEKLFRPLRAAD